MLLIKLVKYHSGTGVSLDQLELTDTTKPKTDIAQFPNCQIRRIRLKIRGLNLPWLDIDPLRPFMPISLINVRERDENRRGRL